MDHNHVKFLKKILTNVHVSGPFHKRLHLVKTPIFTYDWSTYASFVYILLYEDLFGPL